MKHMILFVVIMFAAIAVIANDTQTSPVPAVEKYDFKLYVLAKGKMKKNTARPDFGWRVLKAFPLRVKEFTYPAPFLDYNAPEFKAAAEKILSAIDEPRRKNACRVADAVFEYINTSVTAREVVEEISETPHKVYLSAFQAVKEGKACVLEKCRLATAMLRYFSIPARIVSREGGYEVEYYIQPLTEQGKGGWYLYGFDGKGPGGDEFFVPAEWHPIDAKELLREEWESRMYIKLKGQKTEYLGGNDVLAQAAFSAVTETGKELTGGTRPKEGYFYVIYKMDYELRLENGIKEAKAEFTLPFNIPDDFKTIKYFIKTADERLAVKAKWPQTKTIPSQEGIIYTLPVVFKVKAH